MSLEITKDTTMGEIISQNLGVLFLLKKYDMYCATCAARNNDTIEACANTHNIDLDELISGIKKYFK